MKMFQRFIESERKLLYHTYIVLSRGLALAQIRWLSITLGRAHESLHYAKRSATTLVFQRLPTINKVKIIYFNKYFSNYVHLK